MCSLSKGKMVLDTTYCIQAGDVALSEENGVSPAQGRMASRSRWKANRQKWHGGSLMGGGCTLSITLWEPMKSDLTKRLHMLVELRS